jgi:hypothetical protein
MDVVLKIADDENGGRSCRPAPNCNLRLDSIETIMYNLFNKKIPNPNPYKTVIKKANF